MAFPCPKGHDSSDPDYCSECGARIGAPPVAATSPAPAAPATAATAPAAGETCPDCGTPRVQGMRFCEVCRHDFVTGGAAPLAPAAAAPTPAPAPPTPAQPASPASAPQAPAAPMAAFARLSAAVLVDPTLVAEPDPQNPCPVGAPERVFPLDLDENLIGRRSDQKDVHPEIPIADPGISRRHAKLVRRPDGGFAVLELGSTNGTKLNGKPLEPGVAQPVEAGDELVLGAWTRVAIRAR